MSVDYVFDVRLVQYFYDRGWIFAWQGLNISDTPWTNLFILHFILVSLVEFVYYSSDCSVVAACSVSANSLWIILFSDLLYV